jgi:Cys-tRNA(Pro)/Cys-tRNA(Cys) deacylase
LKKLYPTYIDETAQLFDKVYFSAGVRGTQILLRADDLVNLINGKYTDLT